MGGRGGGKEENGRADGGEEGEAEVGADGVQTADVCTPRSSSIIIANPGSGIGTCKNGAGRCVNPAAIQSQSTRARLRTIFQTEIATATAAIDHARWILLGQPNPAIATAALGVSHCDPVPYRTPPGVSSHACSLSLLASVFPAALLLLSCPSLLLHLWQHTVLLPSSPSFPTLYPPPLPHRGRERQQASYARRHRSKCVIGSRR
ncbi:hypothetical protein GY45DRAFT_1091762 [Cubamyces sp. BRFM 1775]|nr:hypothetical protein GY45DRAFT_1091762 [Cubamyces sp. BRFM 1775]